MRKHKKYRIRKYSPMWWIENVAAGAGIIAGAYAWIILLASIPA